MAYIISAVDENGTEYTLMSSKQHKEGTKLLTRGDQKVTVTEVRQASEDDQVEARMMVEAELLETPQALQQLDQRITALEKENQRTEPATLIVGLIAVAALVSSWLLGSWLL